MRQGKSVRAHETKAEKRSAYLAAESPDAESTEEAKPIARLVARRVTRRRGASRDDPTEWRHRRHGSTNARPPRRRGARKPSRSSTSARRSLRPSPARPIGKGGSSRRGRLAHAHAQAERLLVVELELGLLAHAVQSRCLDRGGARRAHANGHATGLLLGRDREGRRLRHVRDGAGGRRAEAGKLVVADYSVVRRRGNAERASILTRE